MSDTPDTPAPPVPALEPTTARPRPWWLPGVLLGGVSAILVLAALGLRSPVGGTHKAVAFVQLKPRHLLDAPFDESRAAHRDRQRFILTSRGLITQTLAEPAVASLDSVRAAADPVGDVESGLDVRPAAPDVLEVSLAGDAPDDLKAILDHLVRRYVDEATGFDQRDRADQRKKLEQLYESVRVEIEALEKNIELLIKANGTGPDAAARVALAQRRLADVEQSHAVVERELIRLEAEQAVLRRPADAKAARPVEGRDARLLQLATAVAIRKEEREKLRASRDALARSLSGGGGADSEIQRMRDALRPQRASLDKVGAHLAQLRLNDKVSGRVEMRGEVHVSPTRTPAERLTAAAAPVATAFAGGFVLATALSFVGLVFRVLRRHA